MVRLKLLGAAAVTMLAVVSAATSAQEHHRRGYSGYRVISCIPTYYPGPPWYPGPAFYGPLRYGPTYDSYCCRRRLIYCPY